MELTIDYVINELNPCEDAVEWLEKQSNPQTAWKTCPRGDWMLWLLTEANLLTEEQDLEIQLLVLGMPLHDGRKVIDLITDERSLVFIGLKRRKLAGEMIDKVTWVVARAVARAWLADELRKMIPDIQSLEVN